MREILLNGKETRVTPRAVRKQCIWLVKDYERLKTLARKGVGNNRFGPYEIVLYADDKEGLIPAGVVDNATYKLRCIDLAMEDIPLEFRNGILLNIIYHKEFGEEASEITWNRWKDKFINNLAKKLQLC